MVVKLDRRLHAYRPDLADEALIDRVSATRFVRGADRVVIHARAPLRREPSGTASLETEALFGETLRVFDEADGWAWVQSDIDGYVGYVPSGALGAPDAEAGSAHATHSVRAPATFLFPEPDIKTPPLMRLPLNARLRVVQTLDGFAELAGGGYVFARHVSDLGTLARDHVAIAEGFIGTPYLWGGRTRAGIDCSGLVQAALHAVGLPCPRDSDMQSESVGEPVEFDVGLSQVKRGDLIFWKGHVGMLSAEATLLHANAFHMTTVVEPLGEAVERIRIGSGLPLAVRRPQT